MAKRTLLHVPLERYQSRYTSELHVWERTAFSNVFDVVSVAPPAPPEGAQISSGEVLDTVARPLWALEQMKLLLSSGPHLGPVYFSDFFTPGLEALAYSRLPFKAASFCWAQTFDQYDFTRKVHLNWMRPWEIMAFEIYSKVFVACPILKDLIVTALPHIEDKVVVSGLPYNHHHVFSMLRQNPSNRGFDVVYAARWDTEKQPSLFLDLVEATNVKAVVCTGLTELRGTDMLAVQRAKELQAKGKLTILTNLSRPDYFFTLASSKVIFNCGLQDWISYTLLDALTFGCMPLYPMHRSFVGALFCDENFLYAPGSLESALRRLEGLLSEQPSTFPLLTASVLTFHNEALRIITNELSELGG